MTKVIKITVFVLSFIFLAAAVNFKKAEATTVSQHLDNKCNQNSRIGIVSHMWSTKSGARPNVSQDDNAGQYTDEVNVTSDANEATIQLYGASKACRYFFDKRPVSLYLRTVPDSAVKYMGEDYRYIPSLTHTGDIKIGGSHPVKIDISNVARTPDENGKYHGVVNARVFYCMSAYGLNSRQVYYGWSHAAFRYTDPDTINPVNGFNVVMRENYPHMPIVSNIGDKGPDYFAYGCDVSSYIKVKINREKPIKYQTQARSSVKVKQGDKTVRETVGKQGNGPIVAKVGQKIEFNHQLKNLGDATDDTIDQVIIRGLRDYGPAHGIIGTDHLSLYNYAKKNNIKRANKGKGEIFAEAGDGKNNQMNSNYLGLTIRPEHVGKTFCTDITWTAKGGRKNMGPINDGYQFENSAHNSATYPACVYVPYENDIQPCMSNGGSSPCGGETEGEPGTKITGVPKIKNGGNTKTPSNTQWVITKWEVPNRKENIPAPTQIDNEEKDPCKHYKSKFDNAAANCGVVAKSGSGDNSIGANATLTNFGNISAIQNFSVPENAQIGTRFCFAISVSPRILKDSDTSEQQAQVAGKEWRHSAPLCFKVVKKPKLQVWGGGIFSNKGIKASSSVYETKGTFSSWSEFEAMTGRNGRIISFNSASSNTQTKLNFGSASAGWENLIGRNKDGHIAAITALYGSAAKNDPARRIAVENYTSSNYPSSSISLSGSANNTAQRYNDGWTRVIYAKNLLIDGDITSRNNIANGVQQTIIVADNIRISNKVNRIDAWLITRGNGVVNTCAQNANNDTISYVNEANCSRQLTINGPILTNRFLPWRTAYSDIKNPDKPSEIINQRADSYLWANKQTSAASRTIRTTYSKELPIRY